MNSDPKKINKKRSFFGSRTLKIKATLRNDIAGKTGMGKPEARVAEESPPATQREEAMCSGWNTAQAVVTDASDASDPVKKYEDRRATADGPQIFCVLIDNSISMEKGSKAAEATRVLADFMAYASQQNGLDGTGRKTYFYTQVVMFAEDIDDVTEGIVRPPARLKPDERWQIRHPACADRLGNTTDYRKALEHVHTILEGPQGITPERIKAAMPAPVALLITDGKPTRPLPESHARDAARAAAECVKSLRIPEAARQHPTLEWQEYPATTVKLVTIGLGMGKELDSEFLEELASTAESGGETFPLYLHCPDVSQLRSLGTQIVGTMTSAEQRAGRRLEDVIRGLRAIQ